MNPVFRNHIVICGWNERGASIVTNLQALSKRPIVVLHDDISAVIGDVGKKSGLFIMKGDCSDRTTLEHADVGQAYSVLVLAIKSLGASADARSVQIALAVERIRTAVYTIVELKDIQNKQHFSWTKVDDLVTDQEIAVRIIAQSVRHLIKTGSNSVLAESERKLLKLYRQLIDPQQDKSQIYRLDLEWDCGKHLTFSQILKMGLPLRTLPLAVVGFKRHRQPEAAGESAAWISWKGDVISNPPATARLSEIWPEWPSEMYPLGILVLASNRAAIQELTSALTAQQAA